MEQFKTRFKNIFRTIDPSNYPVVSEPSIIRKTASWLLLPLLVLGSYVYFNSDGENLIDKAKEGRLTYVEKFELCKKLEDEKDTVQFNCYCLENNLTKKYKELYDAIVVARSVEKNFYIRKDKHKYDTLLWYLKKEVDYFAKIMKKPYIKEYIYLRSYDILNSVKEMDTLKIKTDDNSYTVYILPLNFYHIYLKHYEFRNIEDLDNFKITQFKNEDFVRNLNHIPADVFDIFFKLSLENKNKFFSYQGDSFYNKLIIYKYINTLKVEEYYFIYFKVVNDKIFIESYFKENNKRYIDKEHILKHNLQEEQLHKYKASHFYYYKP